MNALLETALSAFCKPKPPPAPYGSNLTQKEKDECAAVQREVNAARLRDWRKKEDALYRYALEIEEAHRWLDLDEAWRECYEDQRRTIEGQQRVIDSLLAYIATCPLPEAARELERAA